MFGKAKTSARKSEKLINKGRVFYLTENLFYEILNISTRGRDWPRRDAEPIKAERWDTAGSAGRAFVRRIGQAAFYAGLSAETKGAFFC